MDSLCGLVEKLRDLVLNLLWEQLLYLVSSHRNIDKLNQLLEELELERRSVQHRIDEATNNAERIDDRVRHWMQRVQKISDKVQKFHEEVSQAKTECSLTSCPNLWLQFKLGKKAKEMAQEVAEIYGTQKFDKVSYRKWMLELTSNEGLHTRMLIIHQIMEKLQNPSVSMIGLCGLGGVGKTTIAKEVENQKMFEKVIMATVSDHANVEDIQYRIAEKLGMQLNEKTTDAKASHLCKRLKQEKNMLLILDDLWTELNFAEVGIPVTGDENNTKKNEGCKVLLTSRNEMLLSNLMKRENIIKVGVFLDNKAWELFKCIAELFIESSGSRLMFIAREIVRECRCLPLAIVTVAEALRNIKDLNVWENALACLKNPLPRNIIGIEEVDSILRWSYDHQTEEIKHIFWLSSMLTHDPEIKGLLLMYSMGLDFLKHIEDMEDAQARIFAVVSKLKSLNVLVDSFSSQHDVIREIALFAASKELPAFIVRQGRLKEWPDQNLLEGYKGICLEKSDISDIPEELFAPRLEFFLLNSKTHDLAIPGAFFKSTKELKLLSLVNVSFSSLPSLISLKKLKTLCLHSCMLENITQVGSLKQLTTLSLAYSKIEHLPFELALLTSLQMLNLAHCSELKVIPPKLLSSWKKLEVLHMENSFDQWKTEGSTEGNENAGLDELKGLPISSLDIYIPNASVLPENLFLDMNLKRYSIFIGKHFEWYDSYETSKTLKLELKGNIHLKHGVRKLLEGVEDLYLHGSNGLENVLYNRFPHLRHLQIESNAHIEYIFLSSIHHEFALPLLETLKIEEMNGLKMLCQGPIAPAFIQNLKVIKVSRCQHLKWIFSASMVGSFSQLVEIEIRDCDSLKEVVTFAIEDSSDQPKFANDVIVFKYLRTLRMERLPALIGFCIQDGAASNNCNETSKSLFNNKAFLLGLKHLKLFNTSNIRYLVMWNNQLDELIHLQNLETMEIADCNNLHSLFDIFDTGANNGGELLAELRQLCLRNLDSFTSIMSKDHLGRILNFKMLNHLTVCGCKQLKYLLPLYVLQNLEQLQNINVSDCEKLKRVFGKDEDTQTTEYSNESQLANLHSLKLNNLPELRQLCLSNLDSFTSITSKDHLGRILNFKMLNHLTVCGCKQLKYILPLYVLQNIKQLQNINVSDCEKLKRVFGEDEDTQMMEYSNESQLTNLHSLTLNNLPELASICPGAHRTTCSSLKLLIVEKCPNLTLTSANHLVNIKKQDPSEEKSKNMIIPSALENLHLGQVNHLKMMYNDHAIGFWHLTVLKLYECNDGDYVFSLSMAKTLSCLNARDNFMHED